MTIDPRETFSKTAERYLDSTDHRTGPDLKIIQEAAQAIRPGVTVDIAAGVGHALKAAAPYSGFALAVDLTPEMLKAARENLGRTGLKGIGYVQARAEKLPLPRESVNLATCRIACHHFSSVVRFLCEVRRVLASDGTFIMVDSLVPRDSEAADFLNRVESLRDPSHVRSFTREQWLGFFRTCGLPVSSVSTFKRTHPFAEWARRAPRQDHELRTLEEEFKNASPDIKEAFRIEQDSNGSVISYTDEKVIVVAQKR